VVIPLDTLQLFLVHRVEADGTADPFVDFGSVEVVEDAGVAEDLFIVSERDEG